MLPMIAAEPFMAPSIRFPMRCGGGAFFLPGRYSRNSP
jgi:hypothetical protein